jgi:hypothetical protein
MRVSSNKLLQKYESPPSHDVVTLLSAQNLSDSNFPEAAKKRPPLLSMATSNIPPSALYSSMAAAITAATITMAPTTNQFLRLVRACAAR